MTMNIEKDNERRAELEEKNLAGVNGGVFGMIQEEDEEPEMQAIYKIGLLQRRKPFMH